ncbi:MAG: orotidine-5'-phosphate decarboxylase [Pseudomonadales bacterium]|nr:orotidine-5'-phosphate decarboxylase [Pseudomonadales bacterium]
MGPAQDNKRIIVALDYSGAEAALAMLDRLDPDWCRVKVGKELFTSAGPDLVRRMVAAGFEVFLDLKFHDIPNTVAAAVAVAADLGVWMVNVHAAGGAAMMQAAREALAGTQAPLLIAVTVLTSMGEHELRETGVNATPQQQVLRLAALAAGCGLDGVVCSAGEAPLLRARMPQPFRLVTPGIRPSGDSPGDQHRVETPASAIAKGSDYLVIGRPITQAPDPVQKLKAIMAEIQSKI